MFLLVRRYTDHRTDPVADAGHGEFSDRDDMWLTLSAEWDAVNGHLTEDLLAGWDWDANPAGPVVQQPTPESRTAFTEREIAVAVAAYDCREALDFDARFDEIDLDLQQQFVDVHRAELEAFAEHMSRDRQG